ncbi:uncharacterized protein LOC116017620 [Ipomoea triloba]|uniref:uncharacterized protein LOC116017620 n=1 Tax=Ipomoea triloba TaxID=35885 RepID=UPI00125D9128|nr:uncharacterized protein LOC116017620 [Ipomoea triloba]
MGIPSFSLGLTQEHPSTRWEKVVAIRRHYDVVPAAGPIHGSTSNTLTAVCVTNHSSTPDLIDDHPTQLWAEAEVIARKYDVVPTLDTSRGSTSNPTPAGPIAVPVFAGPQHQSSIGKAVQNSVTKINQSEGRAIGSNDNDKTPIQQIPRTHPGYSMVFNQTCAAPQKFSRQPLGAVVPLRTIDWNSYAPRTRTRTLQMRSVKKPESQVVYDWMATNVNLDRNAELFNYGGWSARREDFMSLLEGNQVAVAIINAWASLLNFRERGKPIAAPSRFFVSTATTLHRVSNFQAPRSHRLQLFTERMEAELKLTSYATWGDVDMFIFPILHGTHYYVISVDVRRLKFVIIDNLSTGGDSLEKYGQTHMQLHDLLSVFFEDSAFPALYIKVTALQPRRLRMSWRETKNSIDSGVFAMRHMETYVGQSIASWDCGIRRGDARCVREMRVRLMSELLLFHNNTHRLPNVNAVGGFEATIR